MEEKHSREYIEHKLKEHYKVNRPKNVSLKEIYETIENEQLGELIDEVKLLGIKL